MPRQPHPGLPLLQSVSDTFGLPIALFYRAVVDVLVDDEEQGEETAAELSGNTMTLTLATPVAQGQTVQVAYNNIFARDAAGLFVEEASHHLPTFPGQDVTNTSTVASDEVTDSTNLVLSQRHLEIDEGSTATFAIALSSQPTADVTVTTSSYPEGDLTTSPASLTFTTENCGTAQTVTLASAEDEDYLNDWARLTYTAAGRGYDDESAGIRVLNAENDTEE